MKLTFKHWMLIAFNTLYIFAFTAYYVSARNYEFLWYVAVLVFFFGLIFATIHRSQFPLYILWGLSLWGFIHMAGGGIHIGDRVLYAQQIIPIVGSGELFILKYDQLVHFFGFGVATLLVYHVLKPYLTAAANWNVIYPILIAAGAGLGVLNEIIEFIAVLASPETGVGGYGNTLLDLIFNTLGATTAVILIHLFVRPKETAPDGKIHTCPL